MNLHRHLWREPMPRAVDVALESHAVVVDVVHRRQAEHLKAAAVSEDRAVPAHEAMQAAHVANEFAAGAQVQVIRVGEDQRRGDCGEVARGHRLDGRLCPNRRKHGRRDVAVRGMQNTCPRTPVLCDDLK